MPDFVDCSPALDRAVLVLGGPTATGKSELAAGLARAVGGAVVSADSRQVYRGLEVGTAQPDAELRGQAPHYLVGFLSPAADYSAGDYGTDARRVIAALGRRGLPAVLCGGTGLYLRAALEGVPGGDVEPAGGRAPSVVRRGRRAKLAGRWAAEGPAALHAELARVDPVLAARLHPRDRQRVLRGLEFHREHGRPLSGAWRGGEAGATEAGEPGAGDARRPNGSSASGPQQGAAAAPLRFRLELPLAEIERRIAARLEGMLRRGLVDEARALFERYGEDPPQSLDAVGYPQLFAHFRGETDLDGALRAIRLRSRQYAKRQRTWFRNQDGYVPVPSGRRALKTLLDAWRPRLA